MSTENEHDDADIRALLHETAAGISTHGSLDEIKERIVTENSPRRWVLPTLAAAAAMALVVGGIGYLLRDDDSSTAPPAASPTDGASGVPAETDVSVWYAGATRAGHGLFTETHPVASVDGRPDLERAVQLAVSGEPHDPDYRTLWPGGVSVTDVGFSGGSGEAGTINVSLDGPVASRPAGMSEQDALLAVSALVRTAQAVAADAPQADSPVAFLVDGAETATVLGLAGDTFGPGEDDEVMAPVQVLTPTDGATVPAGSLTVTGVAAAFEANLNWELLVGGDAVVANGFATAAECCTLSPYSFQITDLAPGSYTLVVHDVDESGGEGGGGINQDSKEIVVE